MEYELHVVTDVDELTRTAAETIINKIHETLRTEDVFTLALSGGSTPRNLFALLATDETCKKRIPWEKVHFFWGDERHVLPAHSDSNYRMAHDAMLSRVPVPSANVHRVRSEEPDAEDAAKQYEHELRAFFRPGTGQLPRFDCVLLGMGPDGHTASLFPGSTALAEESRLVVANWVEKFQAFRITMTVPVLNNADMVIFLVSGGEKAETLKAVLEGEEKPDLLPSQMIKPTHGRLLWLVDKAAAAGLSHKGA
jgi:6-phosphogluconolactonase